MGYYDVFYLFENDAEGSPDAFGGEGRKGRLTPVCPRCLAPVSRPARGPSDRPSCPACGSPLHPRA